LVYNYISHDRPNWRSYSKAISLLVKLIAKLKYDIHAHAHTHTQKKKTHMYTHNTQLHTQKHTPHTHKQTHAYITFTYLDVGFLRVIL